MDRSKVEIVLVTPVWNDSTRLSVFGAALASALKDADFEILWVIADDGSSLTEQEAVQQLAARFRFVYPRVETMLFDVRGYKWGAIYRVWDTFPAAKWLAFVDADGAITAETLVGLIRHALADEVQAAGVVGVRHHSADAPVKRSIGRQVSFQIFSLLVQAIVGLRFKDTQCGAKIVDGREYRAVAHLLKEQGYISDVELLVALKQRGCIIHERRIAWNEIAGSKICLWRDFWPMLCGMLRIRKRLNAGVYDVSER